MAINTNTPAWLESLSARPVDYSGLGKMVGRYAGAALTAATGSGDESVDSKPYYQRFRTDLANTYKQDQDPNWRIKEFMYKRQYEQGVLQGQSLLLRNEIAFKQMQQQAQSERELADLTAKAQAAGNNPMAVPYSGTNPYTLQHWGNVQLMYSRSGLGQKEQQTRTYVNEAAKNLLPEDFSAFIQLPRGDNGLPTQEGWSFLKEASARAQARKEKVEDFRFGVKDTSLQKNIKAIFDLETEAQTLLDAGDKEGAKTRQDQAALMREQMKGQNVVIGYDDQNKPIIQIGKGAGPTVATQSRLQENMVQFENALELMSSLQSKLGRGDVGAKGVIGEYIGDKLLPQVGLDTSNPERIKNRTELGTLRESLLRIVSGDQRFSNADRQAIERLLPNSGVFESLPDAMGKIEKVRDIISDRMRVASRVLGRQTPLAVMTPDEIGEAVKNGTVTQKQAQDALIRFHGYTP